MLETAGRWTPHAVGFASALNISALNLGSTRGETLQDSDAYDVEIVDYH